MHGRIASALRVVAWVLGLTLTALLLRRVGLDAVRAALGRAGPSFFWTVAAYAAATAVGALPWGMLIPRAERPSWRAVVTSRFAASGLNAILPFFSVGDAGRLLWMRRPGWSSGTAAIIVDRLLFLLAGVAVLGVGVASSRSLAGVIPSSFGLIGAAVALAILGGVAFACVAVARGRLVGRLGSVFGRRLGHRLRRRAPPLAARGPADASGPSDLLRADPLRADPLRADPLRAETLRAETVRPPESWDAIAGRMLTGSRRRLAAGLALHVASRALFAFEIYAGLRVLGLPAGWRETTIFAAVPVALSVIGTVIPGQIGVQEAAQALIATSLGIGPSAGLALALLQRARQLLFIPLSGLLVAFVPGGARASDP